MKKTKKEQAQQAHKVIILCDLLLDELADMGFEVGHAQTPTAINEVGKFAEELVEEAYKNKIVKNTHYLTQVGHKVDTVIRKNYRDIFE